MYQSDLLAGRTFLVTGGGTGLGRAMAMRYAELGATIAICGRRTAPLEATCADIAAAGGKAHWVSTDVRDMEAVEAAIVELEAKTGPIDGLVNNAAGNFLCASEDLSPGAFDSVVKIVLYGTFNCTQALGKRWIERDTQGAVINIVTTYAWMGSAFVLPSAAAKAGVLAMTRSLAVEWATYGIRLNAIAPGPIPTEGAFSRLMAGGMEKEALARIPAGRFGRPDELADLAVYLMSPAAQWVTGEVVTLDGAEWLKSGQEFSGFTSHPRANVKAVLNSMRPKKK